MTNPLQRSRTLLLLALAASLPLAAQTVAGETKAPAKEVTWRNFQWKMVQKPFQMKYSRRGLELQNNKGNFTSRIRWRLEPRMFTPNNEDPRRASQFGATTTDQLIMQRARLKVEGKMFGKWVNYKYEQDLVGGRMIDLYADFNLQPWFKLRAGQWKSIFSQERYISSGSQTMVDRSIVNREFTIDRQSGAMLFGRTGAGKRWDSSYFFEITGGSGINSVYKDGSPMLVGRYQWNMFGHEPEFASSDIEGAEHPEAFIALTGLRNRSRYTRFSSTGGGQLDGFTAGLPGQYTLKQLNAEFMLKYKGWSIQNENHWKSVLNNLTGADTHLRGSYIMTGYFPHHVLPAFPKEVELAYRFAYVDGNTAIASDIRTEQTVGINFFLEGHTNKFTIDTSFLSLQRPGLPGLMEQRVRAQYDVHF